MKDMLDKIIAVDRKAKETVDEAKRERESVEKKLFEAKKSIEEEYSVKAQEETEKMRKEKLDEFELSQKEIKAGFEEKKKLLEEKFSASSDLWAKELTKRALGV